MCACACVVCTRLYVCTVVSRSLVPIDICALHLMTRVYWTIDSHMLQSTSEPIIPIPSCDRVQSQMSIGTRNHEATVCVSTTAIFLTDIRTCIQMRDDVHQCHQSCRPYLALLILQQLLHFWEDTGAGQFHTEEEERKWEWKPEFTQLPPPSCTCSATRVPS